MTSISLPNLPKGKEFEEYISAFFQAAGYYIERNIVEREVEEVLELDIIITDYSSCPPEIKLVEVKSGEWGFPDLFKVLGWMHYLNIDKGIFITCKEKSKANFYIEKAKGLNIDLVIIPDLSMSRQALADFMNFTPIDDRDISVWRFSYWIERNLLQRLNHKKRSHPDKKRFKAMEDYYFEITSGIFFTEHIIHKVDKLYTAFQQFPHLSAKCGNEMIGNIFDEEYDTLPERIYKDTYYKCKYNDIQISTFIEHRARLAILKNAIDYHLYRKARLSREPEDISRITGLNQSVSLKDLLPRSFQEGLNKLSEHKYFHRYPIFWQWFMWVFGGFILKDYEEREYELMSQKTGIPVEEIPKALEVYQILFPQKDGWFIDFSPSSNIRVLRMFPVPFMGIGANYRKWVYTKHGMFEELKLSGKYTLRDLSKWNNLTVEVLKSER